MFNRNIFRFSLFLSIIVFANSANSATYWVDKSGNNANDCLSEASPCLTIYNAGKLANQPGDIVNIKSGVYKENNDGEGLEYFNIPIGIKLYHSGAPGNPITFQAAPGHEGKVIIDGQGTHTLFLLGTVDYIVIKNLQLLNAYGQAIGSRGQRNRIYTDVDRSIGVHILNNYIYNVNSNTSGANIAAIRLDHSKDWVIRNNTIDYITENGILFGGNHTSGIQSYEYVNALVENNTISNVFNGILWKDHVVIADDGKGNIVYPPVSAEVRNNIISNVSSAISLITNEANGDEASNHRIHHNIINNATTAGVYINMSNSLYASQNLMIEHNVFDNVKYAITNDSFRGHTQKGNIFVRCSNQCIDFKDETDHDAELVFSNYNLFDGKFYIAMDRGGLSQTNYKTLADWQAAKAASHVGLAVDNPDVNSKISDVTALFNDADNGDYTHKVNSPALSIMPDKTNAGPYQTGTEIIGLLPGYPSFDIPQPPLNLSVK